MRHDRVGLRRIGLAAVLAIGGASAAAGGWSGAAAEGPARVVLSLSDAVARAVRRSPEVQAGGYDVETFLAKQQQADAARFPRVEAVGIVGPSLETKRSGPRADSRALESINREEGDVTSAFGLVDFAIIQPLYTFGLISNLREAAAHGVAAQRAAVDKTASEVALRVREAYWGLVLARELSAYLEDLHEQLLKAADREATLIEGGFASEQDLFKLRTFQGELEKNLNLARRLEQIAQEALRVWTGADPASAVEPADDRLPTTLPPLPPLESYLQDAKAKRPEFTQLREGLRAKEALVEAERARYWPMLFFGIIGSAAYAPNRDRVRDNAHVTDPFHHAWAGPVVGLKYELDFGITRGRVREAEAEVGKLRALTAHAEEGIPLQVEKAWGEVEEAGLNVEALDRANDNARKWVVASLANFDLGIGDSKDLADAVLAMAKSRGDYLQALFSFHLGLARLDQAAGRDIEEIRGMMRETGSLKTREVSR